MQEDISNISSLLKNAGWIAGKGDKFCRKSFQIPEETVSAALHIAADKHHYNREKYSWMMDNSFLKYRLFLNGIQFGTGPFRTVDDDSHAVHSFDISGLLAKGENLLGVISKGCEKGFALCIEIICRSGRKQRIYSDASWKILDGCNIFKHSGFGNEGTSLFNGGATGPGEVEEHIDGNKFPDGWLEPDYDDSKWANALPSKYPGEKFEICSGLNYELKTVTPLSIEKKADGHFFIDFGRELIAGLELDAPPVPGAVEIKQGEELSAPEEVRHIMRTGNHYRNIWTFSKSNQALANFGLTAFRYVEINGWHGELKKENIRAISTGIPFRDSDSSFEFSDKKLETVWDFCKNTIKTTTLDIYQDCPSRERIAYEGDSYINMLSHFAVEYNPSIVKRAVEYQLKHPTWPCEWRQFSIPLVYEYLMYTGDFETAERNFEFLRDNCSFHQLLENGLIKEFPLKIIIDWPPCYRDDYEIGENCLVPNAFAFYNLELLGKLSKLLNRNDAKLFEEMAFSMKSAINQKLYDPASMLYRDGTGSSHSSFHANMFALFFDLVPEERIKPCLDFIVGKGMICSVYAAQFYLETLFKYNRGETAVALMESDDIHSSWLGMLKQGATTTMEAWHPDHKPNLSWAHPWATAPANVIERHLFGLRPTVPGWKDFSFKPCPGGLESGKLTVPTPRGKLTVSFKKNGNSYIYTAEFN